MVKRLKFGEKFEHQFHFSACHFLPFEMLSELAEKAQELSEVMLKYNIHRREYSDIEETESKWSAYEMQ